VQFLSADNPDSLRGWNASWAGLDEEKDISDEAIDIVMLCLRDSAHPLIFGAGTPEMGAYQERYERLEAAEECDVFSFPSRDNVFIPHRVFDLAKSLMDKKRYAQEVLAEFVEMEVVPYICKRELGEQHVVTRNQIADWKDVTAQIAARKTGHKRRWIAGADYNQATPNVAWVYKVYFPNIWVLHDIVYAPGKDALAVQLDIAGYPAMDVLVVDDASGEYDRHKGLQSPNSSSRMMRRMGYKCVHNNKNPFIKDRINAFMAKFAPLEGDPTWRYVDHMRHKVEMCLKVIKTDKNNPNKLDKSDGVDHDFDACTYPVVYFEPAARVSDLQGYAASAR
jgi:hypothetical protein